MKILPILLSVAFVLTVSVERINAQRYEELGGGHQGDIQLTDLQNDAAAEGGTQIVQDAYKWMKGIVPYQIDESFSQSQIAQIVLAMREISSRSCIRFVTRIATSHPQFLNVTGRPNGCWATLGMNLLENQLNLDRNGCMHTGQIVHQLLHVLGLTHPQSRPDRDFYVLVQQDALEEEQKHNLDKYQQGVIEDFGIPYDYESILHCQSDAFGAPTAKRASVVPLDNVDIGQRESLSLKDVRKLNKMYDYEFCEFCVRGNCNEL